MTRPGFARAAAQPDEHPRIPGRLSGGGEAVLGGLERAVTNGRLLHPDSSGSLDPNGRCL